MTYAEKLKDPRWQKKRLERLNESGFSCDNCGSKNEELTVHHKFYKKWSDPWDYDNDELVVYCKKCHEEWHAAKEELEKILGDILVSENLKRVSGYAMAINGDVFPGQLKTNEHQVGYADALRTTPYAVRYLISEAEKEGGPIFLHPAICRQSL